MDPRVRKLAKLMINYSLKLKKGQLLLITGEITANRRFLVRAQIRVHLFLFENTAENKFPFRKKYPLGIKDLRLIDK